MPFSVGSISQIAVPILLFFTWSGISLFWASSSKSVVHHTLTWAAYLIFFLVVLYISSSERLVRLSFLTLGVVVAVIGVTCTLEYLFREKLDDAFAFRYARFAEIWAALLPLFFSFILRLKGKNSVWAMVVTSLIWLGILYSTSRGSLISAIAGLIVFGLLRVFFDTARSGKKRMAFALSWLFLLVVLTQTASLTSSGTQKTSTLSRIMTSSEVEPGNSFSKNIRFLFSSVGLEMFRDNPVVGVGADNFGLEFNKYRAIISARPENRSLVQGNEDALPERAHNEYLQIFSELGIIGGFIFLLFLFIIFKLCFVEIRKKGSSPGNILTHAAIAGLVAFLISSSFSSFSFRLVQNGIVFFFLLALLLKSIFTKRSAIKERTVISNRLGIAVLSVGLLFCIGLTAFSSLKATSQYLVYKGEREHNFDNSELNFQTAIMLDRANAAADFSYAMLLFNQTKYSNAAVEFREAIKKGVYTSAVYSYQISAHSLAGENELSLTAASQSILVYPYSTFLRTRYAVLLGEAGRTGEAETQFRIARSIDAKQTDTWQLLITQGTIKAAEAGRAGIGLSKLEYLYPADGVYAVLAERDIRFPDQKFKFATQ